MADAYIFDAVRTPRGKGKKDGSLHEITALSLATQVLESLRDRNGLDTAYVDDVVLGCVAGGRAGRRHRPHRRADRRLRRERRRRADQPLLRLGPGSVNMAAAKVASGEADLAIGGGVESMSRVPMGSDGGAWPTDPSSAFKTYFVPQGVSADLIASLYGFSRDDVDAYAVESQRRAAASWADGRFKKSVIAGEGPAGPDDPGPRRVHAPAPPPCRPWPR
jgi:acetyl-CoA C-acetyltransferase